MKRSRRTVIQDYDDDDDDHDSYDGESMADEYVDSDDDDEDDDDVQDDDGGGAQLESGDTGAATRRSRSRRTARTTRTSRSRKRDRDGAVKRRRVAGDDSGESDSSGTETTPTTALPVSANEKKKKASTAQDALPFKSDPTWTRKHNKSGRRGTWRTLKQVLNSENALLAQKQVPPTEPTYTNIEAPVSVLPAKKYCDVTGLRASYTRPAPPQLRFHSAAVYREILPHLRMAQEYVELRKQRSSSVL